MTQDEIEHMWKAASNDPNHDTNWHDPVVITFAKLVAAREREACAKLCDELYAEDETVSVGECVNAIRARGEA
jgi:hypothetical protein